MQYANQTILTKANASFTELLDNEEAIILDLDTLHYYTLNGSAILVWQLLRNQTATTVASVSAALATAFNLDLAVAERDVVTLLDELHGNGLIECQALSGAAPAAKPFTAPAGLLAYAPPRLQMANSLAQVVLAGSSTAAVAALANG